MTPPYPPPPKKTISCSCFNSFQLGELSLPSTVDSPLSQSLESRILFVCLSSPLCPKNAQSKRTPKCMLSACKSPRTPRQWGKNFCARGQCQLPAPSARPQPLPWCRGSHAGVGEQGEERGYQLLGNPMSVKRELVPLGWKRNTHTSSRRALSLSPPPASSSSTTSTSSSPPTPASLRKRFSSTSTWLLHFEAASCGLYRPGSSLGNVVGVRSRGDAGDAAEGLQVPQSLGRPGWALNNRARGRGRGVLLGVPASNLVYCGRTARLGARDLNQPWRAPPPHGDCPPPAAPFPLPPGLRRKLSLGATVHASGDTGKSLESTFFNPNCVSFFAPQEVQKPRAGRNQPWSYYSHPSDWTRLCRYGNCGHQRDWSVLPSCLK
ncbi:uncharacterized protein LOC111750603 isoform X2 [Loxodonta africana]|uniref:uncharacterized protein LOC111750603 isoform X2 n=1 Tax=Loxodonta africana TaxID=9785 RepID=UPI0030CAA7ED